MEELRFRQIHLDFHTSEAIDGIGKNFSKSQFQEALKQGHVDSITVFSKCHHGWAYHPSDKNEIHPGLKFDLLKEMIDAAHEINVKTPVYISAGLDEKMARRHPEWLLRHENESTTWVGDFMKPGYHQFCMNSPYLDYLLSQIEEVVSKYDADGIFLDIVGVRAFCRCQNCVSTIRKEGKDPRDAEVMTELAEKVYANYTKRVEEVIHSIKPGMKIFHNGGHIRRGRRDLAKMNTHLELESLPTGGWGYDHFPLSARYAQGLGMEFLGMTGKFHNTWGEFGGYKHPNALRYEAALSIANGAKCSIGDQLHPEGIMDSATYKLIGAAYSEVEKKEAWCKSVQSITEVAVLSLEAVSGADEDHNQSGVSGTIDSGAVRMLLEGKILFDVIDMETDFCKYKLIILPDLVHISQDLKVKLSNFLNKGGKILATGESGLNKDKTEFAIDLGVKYIGENPFNPDFFRPFFELTSLNNAGFVMYSKGQNIELAGGTEIGKRENPYFNRDLFTFCSHQHTPNSMEYGGPGMVKSNNGIYIAWNMFEDYATSGSLALKEIVLYGIKELLGEKLLETNLPTQGIVTLMKQENEKRYINHLLYVSPIKRGKNVEVIEDIIPVYDVKVSIKIPEKINKVYLAPQMEELEFVNENNRVNYTVPKLECHQMVVITFL
jgi:hypothetical protein